MTRTRKAGVWPLPGGVTGYFSTALALLTFVRDSGPTEEELRAFLRTKYKVTGQVSINGYVAVLRTLGWIERKSGQVTLTPRGAQVLAARSTEMAWEDLTATFIGFEETRELMAEGTHSLPQIRDILNTRLGTTWKKTGQAMFRQNWLRSIGYGPQDERARDAPTGDDSIGAAFAKFRATPGITAASEDLGTVRAGLDRLDLSVDGDDETMRLIEDLAKDLGATDPTEVRRFVCVVAEGRHDVELGMMTPAASDEPVGKMLKISPGERGQRWDECRDGGYICVGWDGVGDLRAYASKAAFEAAFSQTFSAKYQGRRTRLVRAARKLWSIRDLRAGDVVLANRGVREVLGVGVVEAPGYIFDATRAGYRHLVKVRWDTSRAGAIEPQGNWRETIVRLDPSVWRELLGQPSQQLPPPVDPPPPPLPQLERVLAHLEEAELRIDRRTLRRYLSALVSRRFVVLAGPSGVGKTWLAREVAEALGAECRVISVAPNWSTSEDLLGFRHPTEKVYVDTEFSELLRRASRAWEERDQRGPRAFHVVLDEMNLARVEHYFSRMLSALELGWHDEETTTLRLAEGDEITLAPNLFVIGTVNVDETTHGLADKVFDRAQLIDLSVDRAQIEKHLRDLPYAPLMMQIWDAVRDVAPFAFRTLDDIEEYVKESARHGARWDEALDEQVLQKVLPRIRGAAPSVGKALASLRDLCAQDLPLTRARAEVMLEGVARQGFASFF